MDWSNNLKPEKARALAVAPFLVIDEISMLSCNIVDTIDLMARKAMVMYYNDWMYEDIPFGGIPVILVWDMFQLPPVITDRWKDKFFHKKSQLINYTYKSEFFFDSNMFTNNKNNIFVTELKHCYRQESDIEFMSILDNIREGVSDYKDLAKLNKRLNKEIENWAVILTTTNKNARNINSLKLAKLIWKQTYSFSPRIEWNFPKNMYPIDGDLYIKEWAQIMLLNNDKEWRWVNWTIATIKQIDDWMIWECVWKKYKDDYSWPGYEPEVVVEFYNKKLKKMVEHTVKPVERYNEDEYAVEVKNENDEVIKKKDGSPKMIMVRDVVWIYRQLPMKLAWAITIHKSQWQTFDNVKIDMEWWAFADAQTYVALSRCTKLDWISLFKPIQEKDIRVNNRVLTYYLSCKN